MHVSGIVNTNLTVAQRPTANRGPLQKAASMSATVAEAPSFARRPLGEIAATLPGATAVFRRHKLDFCCGGGVSLATAASRKGLDLADLEKELTGLAATAPAAEAAAETGVMIDWIVTRFHAAHRRDLPELVKLARRVEAVHRDHAAVPAGLADLLARMETELDEHMQKEEQILFPLMRNGGHPMIGHPIGMMMAEHDDHGASLAQLEALTQDFTPPTDACATWRALYTGARKLADDLVEHIHTENNILFPRFAA